MHRSFLSPIDDYSNLPFRLLCQRYGAEAACVPLVNSASVARDCSKASLVDAHPDERNIGVQLVGNGPGEIGLAAKYIDDAFPFICWYNINCGCPSARTMQCGGGSAMLAFPERIVQSVSEIRKRTDKPVSVKIRIRNGLDDTVRLCKALEAAGADFLIIHGRTAAQGYSGKADWGLIGKVKEALGIPLIGNGDLVSLGQAEELVRAGRCDGFMIARAAMGNPMVFCGKSPEGLNGRMELIREYARLHEDYLGEIGLKDLKMKAVNLVSGAQGAAALRNSICRAGSAREIMELDSLAAAHDGS